jgi:glycosyltransferase involved in cell wall biosynthesis
MRYTIVTPTICRLSLVRLCESLDRQTNTDWEHLVVVDRPRATITKAEEEVINSIPERANRSLFYCDKTHKNYGHTCRHQAWDHVKGEYILYVDDDDYFADSAVLETLEHVTQSWAVFTVLRQGQRFLRLPPGRSRTGTGMFVHKKEIGRWPDLDSYEADGEFVDELTRRHSYQVLDSRPLVVLPSQGCGLANTETAWGKIRAILTSQWIIYSMTGELPLVSVLMPRLRQVLSRLWAKPDVDAQ